MAELKPLASLSAGLLARKGSARPAMRRQTGLTGGGFSSHDDLGWNDMGYDVDPHDAAEQQGRTISHGLSPLPSHDMHEREDDAMRALNAAVDRAWDEPSTVEPLVPHAPVDMHADIPPVRLQQKRLALELSVEDHEEAAIAREAALETYDTAMESDALPMADAPMHPAPMPAMPVPEDIAAQDRAPIIVPAAPAAVVRDVAPASVRQTRPSKAPQERSRAGAKGNFAFTLRLDPERHLRLRLLSAASNRSAQQILIALVDDFFSSQPELDALAAQMPTSFSRN